VRVASLSLCCALLLAIVPGATVTAQVASIELGGGWFASDRGRKLRTKLDPGIVAAVSLGTKVSDAVEVGLHGSVWKDEAEHFYSVMPVVAFRPAVVDFVRIAAGAGVGYRRNMYLCSAPAPTDCGGYRYQRSWAASVSADLTFPVSSPVRPFVAGRYITTLGPLGSQPPLQGDVAVYSITAGLRLGGH
jgi:hypothetical protein